MNFSPLLLMQQAGSLRFSDFRAFKLSTGWQPVVHQ
jgi:hypothetical protein